MVTVEDVLELVRDVAAMRDVPVPDGATYEQIEDLSSRIGIALPDDFREWLQLCSGILIGPGGIYGIRPDNAFLDIEYLLNLHPEWIKQGRIPVAGDGSGSYYVLITRSATTKGHPVLFIDEYDYNSAAYVVASNLWSFLWFLLQEEFGRDFWPQDKDKVLEIDPELSEYSEVPRLWEVD